MPIEAELPDGRILEFPDGTNPAVIQATVKRVLGVAPETTLLGQVKEGFKGLVPGAVGLVESAATGVSALLPEDYEKAAREKIASIAGAAKAPFAAAPGYEETVGRKLGEAIGSTVPFLAAGPLGLAGRIGAVGLGVGAGAGEARTRAEKEGATAEQRSTATALGIIPGAMEVFAPFRILSRVPEAATAQGVQLVKRALVAGGEEAAQEAASGFAQNLIAKGIYKPEQELIEGLGEQAAYGGATGAIVQGLMDLALGRRARGAAAPAPGAPGVPGERPIERAERLAAEKAAQQPVAPPVPAPAPAPGEIPAPPPVAETPAPPPIEEPKVRKPGEPPVGGMQPTDIEALGISKKQPIYRRMLGKDLENPEQRAEVLADIENYLTRGNGSEESRTKLAEFKAKFAPPPVVETAAPAVPPAEPAVETPVGGAPAVEPTPVSEAPSVTTTPTEPEAGREGVPVAGKPAAVTPTEGVGVEPTGVVPPVADAGQPAGREAAAPAPVAKPAKPAPAEIVRGEYEPPIKAGLKPERERQLREKLAEQRKELAVLEAARDKAEGNIYLAEITGNEEAKARAIDAHEAARLVLKKATAAADRTYAQIFDMEKADFEGSVGEAYVADLRAEQRAKAEAVRAPELAGSYPYNLKTAEAVQEELRDQASHLPGYKELIEKYFTPSRQLRKGRTEEEFVKEGQKFLSSNTLYQLRQKPAAGMRKEQVENVVAKVTKGWTNLPPIEVVQSETDLPVNIQRQLERDKVSGQVPGLFNDGKVWLIADNNAAPAEIFDTIAHEVTGHYGLQGVLGDKYGETMGKIYNSNSDIRMKAVDKMQKLPKLTRDGAVEEVLADMQEKDRSRPFYKRVVGIIRTALQKLFKGKHYFSPDQVEDLLHQSRTWVRRGKKSEGTTTRPTDGAQFRVTPGSEAAAQGVNVIGEQEEAKPLSGNPALKARIRVANNMAGLMDAFTKWYGGDIRTAMGRLNPMTLISRALDSDRISVEAQLIGGLKKLDGLIVASELTDANGDPVLGADGKPLSYKNVVARIADAAKKAKKPYAEYLKVVDTVLYGHREFNVRKNNELIEQQAQALEAAGKKAEADKLREEIATLAIKDPKKLDQLEAEFQKDDFIKGISNDLDTIRFNFIDMLVETGRISKEVAQEWKDNEGYIPFKRVQDYTEAFDEAGSSRRGVGATRNIGKFKGSGRMSTSVVENFSNLLDWATGEAMRNEARTRALQDMTLMGAAKLGGKPDFDSPGGVQDTFENGVRKQYYVPDPMLMVGFGMQPYEMGWITKALNKGTRVLRAGVTTMPPFAIKQVFDDISRAYAFAGVKNNAELTKNILFNFPKNWANEIFKTELFKTTKGQVNVKDLRKLGIVATFDLNREGNIKDVMVEAGAKKEGLFNTILRVMEAGAKASDLSVRQAIYSQVLKETGDTAKAESAAREIINFSYQGAMGGVRVIASVVPFFNAYAQGMDKLATAAAGKVVGQTTGVARSMFYTRMTYLTAMGLAYALMMQDDEEYNKLPDHVRDTHWILPGVKIDGKPVGIPLAPDLGFFFKAIPERVVRYLKYQGTDEERAAIEVASELFVRGYDVFSPPNVTPQLIRPVLENIVNYSFFLGRPLESQAQLKLRPFERYGVGTSDAMKAVAEVLEDAANATGTEAFAISPIKLENAVRGLLGTTGGIALSMADMMINPDRTDRPLHQQLSSQLTGASAVLKNPVGTRYMDEIYNLEKKTEQVYTTYNRLKKDDPDKADKFLDDNIGMYEIRPVVRAVMEEIRKLNKMAMDIDKDTTLSPEQRRKEIDELRVEQNDIARVVFSLRKEARDIQMGL